MSFTPVGVETGAVFEIINSFIAHYSLYSVYYTVNCIWNDRTRFHHCVISCAGYSCNASGRTQHHVNKQSIQEYSTENIWEMS